MLHTVPPKVTRSSTETYNPSHVSLTQPPLQCPIEEEPHTKGDGQIEDETSTEHLLRKTSVKVSGAWIRDSRAGALERRRCCRRGRLKGPEFDVHQ